MGCLSLRQTECSPVMATSQDKGWLSHCQTILMWSCDCSSICSSWHSQEDLQIVQRRSSCLNLKILSYINRRHYCKMTFLWELQTSVYLLLSGHQVPSKILQKLPLGNIVMFSSLQSMGRWLATHRSMGDSKLAMADWTMSTKNYNVFFYIDFLPGNFVSDRNTPFTKLT